MEMPMGQGEEMPMIEVVDLHKKYNRKKVLNGVSFTAERGQITCLAGLNGAGKSTVLKAIMGLTPIHGGTVLVEGERIDRRIYNRVAFIPDRLPMPPSMKLREAARFMADFYPDAWNGERAREMMTFFDLAPDDRISDLSRGNAAKFNIVLSLGLDTPYVLMDEPFSGIDLFSREAIADVFSGGWLEDRGVLLTTHEIDEVEHLIDKVVLLKDGVVATSFLSEEMRLSENKSIVDVMREVYRL